MRTIHIIFTLTLLFAIDSFGQNFKPSFKAAFLNPNVYRTRVDLKTIRVTDKNLSTVYNDTIIIKASNTRPLDYKIVNDNENGYTIIRVLPKVTLSKEDSPKGTVNVVRFTDSDQLKKDSLNAYNYYFAIKNDAFKPLTRTLLSTKIVGIPLVQPFKLRPDKGSEGWNLGGDFTVSYNFGLRLRLGSDPFSQNFISFVPYGFGIGAAKYFKENADGTLSDKEDAFAVTYYQGGILLTLQKINFGVFTGFDAMIDKKKDWFYQGEPWFSFGLGYKFKND